jgi:hypothetical protein
VDDAVRGDALGMKSRTRSGRRRSSRHAQRQQRGLRFIFKPAERSTITRRVRIRGRFTVTVRQPTQQQLNREAMTYFARERWQPDEAKWARLFAKHRILSWKHLTLAILEKWLGIPIEPRDRPRVVKYIKRCGGTLPYSQSTAVLLVTHALRRRFVDIINAVLDEEEAA